jgi:hypothetical protein
MKSIINKLNKLFYKKFDDKQPVISTSIDTPPSIQPHEWFTGNYPTWEDAMKDCTGYDAPNILEKVKTSLLKVKNGEAVYERDSVLFDHIQYSFPLLVSLLYVATSSKNKRKIHYLILIWYYTLCNILVDMDGIQMKY